MEKTLANSSSLDSKFVLPEIPNVSDTEILAYLRRSRQISQIIALTEQNLLVEALCNQYGITVSDEEWQAAGDAFRMEHKLLGTTETMEWLSRQRITVEDWSEGIRADLLAKKLKGYLFSEAIDTHYMNHRQEYKRVALSQILVANLADALKVSRQLRETNTSFCALAIEFSKGRQSKENGGFLGVHFLSELMPEIAEAIATAEAGEIIGPVQTKLGYHILRVETWFAPELDLVSREQMLDSLFQRWLQEVKNQ
jgi:parvulin-like peptidyl-prolyl isomerase